MPEINAISLGSDANLQAYYRLESDGTDSSGNGYTLSAGTVPSYVSAQFGNGADFEAGSSQFLKNTNPVKLEVTTSQSWSMWIKPESLPGYMQIISLIDPGVNNRWLRITNANKIEFKLDGLTPGTGLSSGTLSTGTWYHVAGVYDSSVPEWRIFLNNIKTTTAITSGTVTANSSLVLRMATDNTETGQLFDGIIDDVAFFDRALTDSEVSSIFKAGFPPSVVFY